MPMAKCPDCEQIVPFDHTCVNVNTPKGLLEFVDWVGNRWAKDQRPARELLAISAIGLSGEAGEVSDHIKKYLVSGKSIPRQKFIEEMGDQLHYWAHLCHVAGIDPQEIIAYNVNKLTLRYPDGVPPMPATFESLLSGQ